jgi:hypothetical protein
MSKKMTAIEAKTLAARTWDGGFAVHVNLFQVGFVSRHETPECTTLVCLGKGRTWEDAFADAGVEV